MPDVATRRLITLSESPNAPTISALCDDTGWNGFHVPLLTADMLADHYAALASHDPTGPWAEVSIAVDSDGDIIRMHCCESAGCRRGEPHEHTWDDRWRMEGLRDSAWIDGLVWADPVEVDDDGEVA